METTLHRQLKSHFAGPDAQLEVTLGRYRIDIVDGARLIEVQHSSLASLRDKVRILLKKHEVEIIKPIIARKRLINLDKQDGQPVSQRWSPKRGVALDLFEELIFFTSVFPHRRLTLRIPLIEIEESRFPKRRRNRRRGQFKVQDQQLLNILSEDSYRTTEDLRRLLPETLPAVFGTLELARELKVTRSLAQRIAYCLRETGCAEIAGKQGNSLQYKFKRSRPAKKANAALSRRRAG